MGQRVTDKERMERIKRVFKDPAEAQDIFEYDKAVEADQPTAYDLPPEKAKVAQKFAHAGVRKQPTTYQFTKRERKPNATKGGIIAMLDKFLQEQDEFAVTDVTVTNKERQIAFAVGGDKFELTLVQKRKPK